MNDLTEGPAPTPISQTGQRRTSPMSVREVIAALAKMEDMDAEFCFSFHNSDPIPVTDLEDNGNEQVVCTST